MVECRPPDGTPDRTQCWLLLDPMRTGRGIAECALWENDCWIRFGFECEFSPRYMGVHGWRFHSISEVPTELTGSLAPKPDLRGAAKVLGGVE